MGINVVLTLFQSAGPTKRINEGMLFKEYPGSENKGRYHPFSPPRHQESYGLDHSLPTVFLLMLLFSDEMGKLGPSPSGEGTHADQKMGK